jgi:uncharacterized membrane protein
MSDPTADQPQTGSRPPIGVDKRLGTVVIYLLGWIGGLLGLYIWGKKDPDLRFHGAQSLLVHGLLTVLYIVIVIVGGIVSQGPVVVAGIWVIIELVFAVVWLVVYIGCLVLAYRSGGSRFEIPVIGAILAPYVETVSAAFR